MSGQMYEHHGSRLYDFGGEKLPSVTTILGLTKDQSFIKDWQQKVGYEKAEQIKNHSSKRGTSMHKFLECHVTGVGYDDLSPIGAEAKPMAEKIIEVGLLPVEEYYGSEVSLHYPGLYAGSTDLVCLHNGKETIVDFKQSNRPKKEEWIEDYFLQLAGYAIAHNQIYETNIQFGIILMCSKDLLYQEFRVEGEEFKHYANEWWKKVAQYYKQKKELQKIVDRNGF